MNVETIELADATREQAQAIERQTASLDAHVAALKSVSKGEQGDKGDTGDVGPQGDIGPQGVRGLQGIKGDKGNVGSTGPKGEAGTKGDTGDKGDDGVGPDERVKVGIGDPTAGFLEDKLEAGDGIRIRRKKSKTGDTLLINATGQAAGGSTGGGSSGLIVYDDGVAVGAGNKVSYDGGDPVTIVSGIIHVPVGSAGPGSDDQTAAEVPFTPAGTIAATNVQAAIEEVAAEASSALAIEDEGIAVGQFPTLDFAGAAVSVAQVGAKAVVTITGGGGGSGTYLSFAKWGVR